MMNRRGWWIVAVATPSACRDRVVRCQADATFPEHGECECVYSGCTDDSTRSFEPICSCGAVDGTNVSNAPRTCDSNTQVDSCDVGRVAAHAAPGLAVSVASCNPDEPDAGAGAGAGSSNCKHSGAECSSSSECCGGSICDSDPNSSFYQECE